MAYITDRFTHRTVDVISGPPIHFQDLLAGVACAASFAFILLMVLAV